MDKYTRWGQISHMFTDSQEDWRGENTDHYLVDDVDEVKYAFFEDLENNFDDEDEDICGFLDRHNIEWK